MPFALTFRPGVERDRARLPKDVQRRFADAFERLKEDPFHARSGLDIRLLAGARHGERRVRVGQYRATYEIVEGTVLILEIGSRGNFY